MKREIRIENIYEDNSFYKITVDIPRRDLTLDEAKELLDKLTGEIEIAEWRAAQK